VKNTSALSVTSDQQLPTDVDPHSVVASTTDERLRFASSFGDFSRGLPRATSNLETHVQAELVGGIVPRVMGYQLLDDILLDASTQSSVEQFIEREVDAQTRVLTDQPKTAHVTPTTDLQVWHPPVLATAPIDNPKVTGAMRLETAHAVTFVPVDVIELRDAYRVVLNTEEEARLELDVTRRGVINPVVIAPLGNGRFRTVVGDRRLRAARAAGHTHVPARIIELGRLDELLLLIAEDVNHQAFDALELSRLAVDIVQAETGASVAELRRCLHRGSHKGSGDVPRTSGDQQIIASLGSVLEKIRISPQTFRRDYLPLLDAPTDVQLAVQSGLKHSLAMQISRVPDEVDRADMIKSARQGVLSVREAKRLVSVKLKSTRDMDHKTTPNETAVRTTGRPETRYRFAVAGSQIDQVIAAQPNLADHPAVLAVRDAITNLLAQLEVIVDV
jgi:ParB family transcriptional regulator, chromosome partitioning protein